MNIELFDEVLSRFARDGRQALEDGVQRGAADVKSYRNQLEPASFLRHFSTHPPEGFELISVAGSASETPAFVARFDVLTSADDKLKQQIRALPMIRFWERLLRPRTAFVGTTVSEYVLLPQQSDVRVLPSLWRTSWGHRYPLLVVKDIPHASPLLSARENAAADALAEACLAQDYVLLEGQALAYVVIDFTTIDGYLERLPPGRRKNLRRKLRSLNALDVRRVATGNPRFDDEQVIDTYYALYLAVYAQSDVHFDKLSRSFFAAVLRDSESCGIVFEYRRHGEPEGPLVGWNLCFESGGMMIDKYIGLAYPAAREHNLYFVSWVVNLEYAIEQGLSHYVAGWTDPQVKAQLGAHFTFTRHAVFIRNPLWRALGRRMAARFEGDRQLAAARA